MGDEEKERALLMLKMEQDLKKLVRDILREALEDYGFCGAIGHNHPLQELVFRNWQTYGSSNFKSAVTGLIMEQLKK